MDETSDVLKGYWIDHGQSAEVIASGSTIWLTHDPRHGHIAESFEGGLHLVLDCHSGMSIDRRPYLATCESI